MVFLPGLGQNQDDWRPVITGLPAMLTGRYLQLNRGSGFSIEDSARRVRDQVDELGEERVDVVGLSLGAMVALRFAADHPDRVRRLVISGGQVHPPRLLMRVQSAVMRVLPSRLVAAPGLSKGDLLATLSALSTTDLRPALASIAAETLVLCGGRDRPNLAAARSIAAGIPSAVLEIVPGVGHEWNRTHPELFAARVSLFLGCDAEPTSGREPRARSVDLHPIRTLSRLSRWADRRT